jgi:phospholipid/cholesterol/gamma-HCH transport system ATP-binding protein
LAARLAGGGTVATGDAIVFDRVHFTIGGRKILEDVSFTVPTGQIKIVMGASGIGKSTILRLILGLIRPQQGDVRVLGESVVSASAERRNALRRRIGMVFQNGALFDSLTVGENVAYSLVENAGMSFDNTEPRARSLLTKVGLEPDVVLDQLPDELSVGMQRRVAIARAIASEEASVLLYDEPTTGLDPISVEMITDIIVNLRQELQVTSIVVTHEIPHALKVGDRFLFLHDKRAAFDGTGEELAASRLPALVEFLEPFKASLQRVYRSFGLENNGGEGRAS